MSFCCWFMYNMVLRLVINIDYKTTLKNKALFNKDDNINKSRTLISKGRVNEQQLS